MSTETRLARIENMLTRYLHQQPPRVGKRMKEKEVCQRYEVSPGRLKQLRLGYSKRGKYYPPQLFNWGSISGRRIDYDVEELDKHFQRRIVGTNQIIKTY